MWAQKLTSNISEATAEGISSEDSCHRRRSTSRHFNLRPWPSSQRDIIYTGAGSENLNQCRKRYVCVNMQTKKIPTA